MREPPRVSVVIPAFDEEASIGPLVEEVARVLGPTGRTFEILVVDDGSRDATPMEVEKRIGTVPGLRLLSLRANAGKSAALRLGFDEARGTEAVVTLDADLQDDPKEIPGMLGMLDEGYDVISGWKRKRRDPWTKTFPSRIWNFWTARLTGIHIHDFNSGFKAYRRPVLDTLDLHGELHRYIPVLAGRMGWRIAEREVVHHPREHGRSKFGGGRFLTGFLDLMLVMFLSGRHRSPLHVFGRLGIAFLAVGGLIELYMAGIWVIESRLRVRPMLLFGVILVILGIQFISMGLLAEMIAGIRRPSDTPVRKRLPEEEGP
ncbi:MAG: glycosyltransferase family 2 protein [Candidatus Eisenbacteria bacterium]|nr:glycosyltransferase family 2 protein [Candidatus Eisenbacteria bacterium]